MDNTNDAKPIGAFLPNLTEGTASPERSTADLDLTALPERLSDAMLVELDRIAASSPPPPIPCDRKQFDYCLRMMISVLPRRQADSLTGELFVAAYEQALWRFSEDAMHYLTQRAIAEKKWFPTVKECLDILEDWRRPQTDCEEHSQRKQLAIKAAETERSMRAYERETKRRRFMNRLAVGEIEQAEINALPDPVVWEARQLHVLRWDRENERFVPTGDKPFPDEAY